MSLRSMRVGKYRLCQGQHLGSERGPTARSTYCGRIFTDHGVSGTMASRPELDKLLDHLRDGDVVVVWKLD
ncbi:DNA invertase Pin-like site-specific DNA recombinase [Arthrobacter tumbae]|nr:DNA invertase Pin-like site-specific DNA recombinase [Arthrobacter tumbae]